jgi:hypothetical protein
MSRRLSAVVLSVCFVVSIAGSAECQGQSPTKTQSIVLEINIVETTGAQRNEIEKMETGRDQINRLIAEGKARLVANLQVRTRTSESFTARVGQRVPIQTAMLPSLRTTPNARDARENLPSQGAAVAIPQISYENTGVVVEGIAYAAGDGLLDIRLKIEMTSIDHNTGNLTPTFTQRSLADAMRMKESDTAMLMGFTQPAAGLQLSLEQIAQGAKNAASGGFVVLLTTKPVQ